MAKAFVQKRKEAKISSRVKPQREKTFSAPRALIYIWTTVSSVMAISLNVRKMISPVLVAFGFITAAVGKQLLKLVGRQFRKQIF